MIRKVTNTLFILLTYSCFLTAQEYEIIQKADSIPSVKEKGLTFIDTEVDLSNFYFIARIKLSEDDVNKVLLNLQKSANELSANAFKLISYKNVNNEYVIITDLFSASEVLISKVIDSREKNVIYFLADDNKEESFKLNGERIKLEPGEIFRYEIPKNQEIKINKGGLTGMTVFVSWKNEQPPIFYALGAYGLSPRSSAEYNQINFNINTGKIRSIKGDFVLLLFQLKK
jgi:hypothetical protein